MSHEDLSPAAPSPTERRLALLHYIRKLALQEQSELGTELTVAGFLELSAGATAEHHRRINRGLKDVEGIPARLGPTDGDQLPITLQEWHGIDLEDVKNHVWSVRLEDGSETTMVISFLADELHQETLEQLTANG